MLFFSVKNTSEMPLQILQLLPAVMHLIQVTESHITQ